MTEYQFNLEVERLKQTFGEKYYHSSRSKLLWEIVKDVDPNDFSKFVDQCLLDMKFGPMGAEFREFKSKWEARQRQKYDPASRICSICADDGRLLALRHSDKTKWAFLCTFCDAAKIRGLNGNVETRKDAAPFYIKKWHEGLMDEYTIMLPPPVPPPEILFE